MSCITTCSNTNQITDISTLQFICKLMISNGTAIMLFCSGSSWICQRIFGRARFQNISMQCFLSFHHWFYSSLLLVEQEWNTISEYKATAIQSCLCVCVRCFTLVYVRLVSSTCDNTANCRLICSSLTYVVYLTTFTLVTRACMPSCGTTCSEASICRFYRVSTTS